MRAPGHPLQTEKHGVTCILGRLEFAENMIPFVSWNRLARLPDQTVPRPMQGLHVELSAKPRGRSID